MSGPEASRSYIDAAAPEHPSLLDPTHIVDALFGVVNIPNVVWIDEAGMIVRPAEAGWPGGRQELPTDLIASMPKVGRAKTAPRRPEGSPATNVLSAGQDRTGYADAIRDWVTHGSSSVYALVPDEVIARSQPRSIHQSEAAAHFELANHLWGAGQRELAIDHFNECHRLQPDNWTYKRQAWSAVSNERVGGEFGRFVQGPLKGEEDEWPFASDFRSDVAMLEAGDYYPATL
jgi:hypothetical protein